MKINTISTYILVCLLTHGHWNLLVPVKAAGEDSTSTADADGTVASTTADGAGETSTDADGSVASPTNEAPDSTPNSNPVSTSPPSSESLAGVKEYEQMLARQKAELHASSVARDARIRDSAVALLKPFKAGEDGNSVEINENDFFQDFYLGYLTYAFKPGVNCTLVKVGEAEVWNEAGSDVKGLKSVTLNVALKTLTVRNADNSAYFMVDTASGKWKHVVTMSRDRKPKVIKTGDSSGSGKVSPNANEASTDAGASSEAAE